jgi:hypothetical protein
MPGDAVCGLEGGGGTEGLRASLPPALGENVVNIIISSDMKRQTFLLTQRFCSLS